MLFNSIDFLIFFPIVAILYYIIPKKVRYLWLLFSSYYFYMGWNAKYALLLLTSTLITYLSGLLISRFQQEGKNKVKKLVVAASFVSNLSILFFFKYFDFMVDNINAALEAMGVQLLNPSFDVLLPVGISFYTFQALSYTMDVYRGEIEAEKNPFKYALFVSFFPQLVAGPIERSKNLLKQMHEVHKFDFDGIRDGLLLMIWGYFLKLVIADRIAIFVDAVYGDYETYGGVYLIVASILFAFQIYCDFSGYSTIAIGAAKVMGFTLMENFNCPYLSRSVSEFWRRWHISLSSWFRDYLYIPLGGNRHGKVRKYLNVLIVFAVSGLWHGANWTYVIWGTLNGVFQVIGELLTPIRNWIGKIFKLNPKTIGHRIFAMFFTFLLVDFTWIFFRADSLADAIAILKSIGTTTNIQVLFDGSLYALGLNYKNFWLMILALCILLAADICKYRGIVLRKVLQRQEIWCRWLVTLGAIAAVVVFGIWGSGYNETNFIYFQF